MRLNKLISRILISLAALSAARVGAVEPFDLMRTLNSLQNKMSHGDETARFAASKQMELIEQALASAGPEAWKDAKNIRAAVIYLLAGGSPNSIRRTVDFGLLREEDKALVSGTLAYAEGRTREAAKLLLPIDPRKLSPTLGGHLALVQGGLLIGSNNGRALALLDLARLLMPGSLVEEAALRREISIVDSTREPEKLSLLGRRYATQYSGSPFIRSFWDEVSAATVRTALHIDDARLVELEELFRDMNPGKRFDVHLAIARRAILNARIALAATQTKKAEPLAQTASARTRIKLYNGVIRAISGDFEEGAAEIQTIDSKSLPRADIEMRDIVAASMKRLQASSEDGGARTKTAPTPSKQDPEDPIEAESPIEQSVRQAIAEADALLERASKQ